MSFFIRSIRYLIFACFILLVSASCGKSDEADATATVTAATASPATAAVTVTPGAAAPATATVSQEAVVTPGPQEYEPEHIDYVGKLMISEICPKNVSGITDSEGRLSDWIEITNISGQTLKLHDLSLTDDASRKDKYVLEDRTLAPGERFVVFASGDGSFKLSSEGGKVYIFDGYGEPVDQMTYKDAREGHSFYRTEYGGDIKDTLYAAPGYPDTDAGYEYFSRSLVNPGPLAISEIQVSNDSLLEQSDGEYYDWAEIVNTSSETVLLSDYYVTDNIDKVKYILPPVRLKPGAYFVIICSGTEKSDASGYHHAGFSLNAESESFYICRRSDNKLIDSAHAERVPAGCSYGRSMSAYGGFYYFTDPTPGKANGKGVRKVCGEAEATVPEGIYEGSVTLRFEAEGTVYYTTDGSVPDTHSKKYTKQILLGSTAVIRTVVYKNGCINSPVRTYSYIIGESPHLPVVSLVTESDGLWSDETGIYVKGDHDNYYQNWERFASVSYIDESGGFNINCGLKMNGGGSRESNAKKSFRLVFRGKYGKGELDYDLFGNGITSFGSLVLRAGEDYATSIIRNDFITAFAARNFPSLVSQTGKYCLLYINGKFFGIYYLEERVDEKYFAEHFGVSEDDVEISESDTSQAPELHDAVRFAQSHDMSKPENYKHMTDVIDIESMTDWFILQAYCGNTDAPGNVKYCSSYGTKWKWVFYDLDWAFFFRKDSFERLLTDDLEDTNAIIKALLAGSEYRDYFLKRLAYHLDNTLTDEKVLAVLDEYTASIEPEIERERKAWKGTADGWRQSVSELRSFIADYDRKSELIESITNVLGLTQSQVRYYFGDT